MKLHFVTYLPQLVDVLDSILEKTTLHVFEKPKSFKSPFWLRNAHAQTIWSHVSQPTCSVPWSAERFELPDGDFVDVFVTNSDSKKRIFLFHGLEGSVESPYMIIVANRLYELGYNIAAMNFRSCGGVENRLLKAYHSGQTCDIRHVIARFREREPDSKFGAIGFSLGGNALLKYLGEERIACPLQAAVAVSAPIDLADCVQRIHRFDSRFYEVRFLRSLRQKVLEKAERFSQAGIDIEMVPNISTVREFDRHITAPLHGFRDEDDYYQQSSAKPYLTHIAIPTLLVQSQDDPMLGPSCIPHPRELSSFVSLVLSKRGGHVGFVYGTPWRPKQWLASAVPSFFNQVLVP